MYTKPWELEVLLLRNPSANVYSVYGILGTAPPRWGENISMQYPTFQEGVSKATKGSFTGGGEISQKENSPVLTDNPITVPRNHMTCPGMEPATMRWPYQTGPSDTNNSFFHSTLLQQAMQKGKSTALNTCNPQIPAPKTPRTKYCGQRKVFLFPRAIRIDLILRIVLLALQSAHQTRPREKGKQTKKIQFF